MRPLQCLRDIAEGQWGLVTLRQANGAGVGWRSVARLAEAGLIERVAHGVYRIRGSDEADHLDLRAAWLQLDPGRAAWERLDDPDVAVVSHASAAALYGVGDFRADVHEFTLRSAAKRVGRMCGSTVAEFQRKGDCSCVVYQQRGRVG